MLNCVQAQKGEVITVREIKEKIAKQAKDKVEKARNALKKAEITVKTKEQQRLILEKISKSFLQRSQNIVNGKDAVGKITILYQL